MAIISHSFPIFAHQKRELADESVFSLHNHCGPVRAPVGRKSVLRPGCEFSVGACALFSGFTPPRHHLCLGK